MQRVVLGSIRTSALVARRPVLRTPVALMHSMDGTDFSKRRKALEEQYFQKLNEEQKKKYAEKLHEKELKSLLDILPPDHNLSPESLHDILVWKHKEIMV